MVPEVVMTRRTYLFLLLTVCAVSAVIGSGITLLAQTGPEGPAGPPGSVGPQGPPGETDTDAAFEAEEAHYAAEEAVSQAEDLEGRVRDLEFLDPVEDYEFRNLEGRVSDLEALTSDICFEVGLIC